MFWRMTPSRGESRPFGSDELPRCRAVRAVAPATPDSDCMNSLRVEADMCFLQYLYPGFPSKTASATVDPGPSSSCMEKVVSHRRLRRMNQSRQGHDQKLEQTVELLLEKLKTAPQPGFERRSSPRRRARRIGRRASL